MHLLKNWNIAYQGASVATLITQIIPIIFLLIFIHQKLKVTYKQTFKIITKVLLASGIMIFILYLLTFIYPLNTLTKFSSLLQTIIYSIIGITIYIFLSFKLGIVKDIFENTTILNKIKKKLKRKNI